MALAFGHIFLALQCPHPTFGKITKKRNASSTINPFPVLQKFALMYQ
jgi:hypothetical protein